MNFTTAAPTISTNIGAQAANGTTLKAVFDAILARQAQLGTNGPLNKVDATAAPGVGDDSADGYAVGSLWVNVTTDAVYVCADASVGAAVWRCVTNALLATRSVLTFDDADSPGGDPAFVNISPEGGHLTLVSAEALGGVFAKISPAAALRVLVDADPATNLGAVALYIDEDGATDGTGKLLADLSGGNTGMAFHLALTNGQVVPVYDVTTPGTPGVAVNWNEPAGELQFTSPTNADATVKTSATVARGFSL